MKRLGAALALATLACGSATTLWGFYQMSQSNTSAFPLHNLGQYTAFLAIVFFAIALTGRLAKVNYLTISTFSIGILALLTGMTWPLLVAIWFWLSSYGLGSIILNRLRIDTQTIDAIPVALVGFVLYGTFVGLIAHYPISYPGFYAIILTIPLIVKWRSISSKICSVFDKRKINEGPSCTGLCIATLIIFYFIIALMPEVGYDALVTHLFVPGHLAQRHTWSFDVTTYVWAVMPMMGDWIFSIAYMLGGEGAARLINLSFIFALSRLVNDLVMWAGGNSVGARWAVLLFLTTPLTFTESTSLFIESIWTSFIVAGSLSTFQLLQSERDKKTHLPIAGFLLGGALAAKAVTFTILPVFALLLILRYRNWLQRDLTPKILLSLCFFIIIGAVPYLTAWLLTANPVFPFFNQIFKSHFWPLEAFTPPPFDKGLSWKTLYKVTFHTQNFLECKPGAAGYQWLILFVPSIITVLFNKKIKGFILFLTAIFSIALTFNSTAYLRYIFPSFTWIAAAIGVALSSKPHKQIAHLLFVYAAWIVVILNFIFIKSGTYYGDFSLQPLLSQTDRNKYLEKKLPIRNAVNLINELNIDKSPVAVFSTPLAAGLNADGLYPNWYNFTFQSKVIEATTANDIANLLIEKNADYVILDNNWETSAKRILIENATEHIYNSGPINVRKLKNSFRFKQELLINTHFLTTEGWSLPSTMPTLTVGQITVAVSSPASQTIPVVSGRRYQNSVTARCANESTKGRLQVNWLDTKYNIVNSDIQIFDCSSSETTYSMEVTAPKRAAMAAVYASGHTNTPIIFHSVSFKQ